MDLMKDGLPWRVGPDVDDEALKKPGCREMDFSRRKMKAWVIVDATGTDHPAGFEYWITLALDFNKNVEVKNKRGNR